MSPFDSARFFALLKGLNISIIPLSLVTRENDKRRIDSGYFDKNALAAVSAIKNLPFETLGSLVSTFRKGIFDIKADTYAEWGEGVPFVRISDLRDGLINKDTTAWIPRSVHEAESKTKMTYGDLVLSKTAYPAASLVTVPECNVSQDIIAVRLSENGKVQFKQGYLVAFLNSKYGMRLMGREFQGNVQQHLSLDDGKKLRIPKLGHELQGLVDGLFRRGDGIRDSAQSGLRDAENTLLSALGLAGWAPQQPLAYVSSLTAIQTAKRLDAQFYAPRIQELINLLAGSSSTIGTVAESRHERFDKADHEEFDYIEIGNLEASGTAVSARIPADEAPSRATWYVREGDIITSTVRPIRRLSAQILPEQDGSVCSSGFVVLRPTGTLPEVLLTFLRLPAICELMDLYASASMYPAISEADILRIPFPAIDSATAGSICEAVRRSRVARAHALELLDRAKRSVEIAIEEDEDAALDYLHNARSR